MKRALSLAALLGLVAVFSGWAATRSATAGEPPHFHSDARSVVIEDRTGNGAWSAAITHAVEAWNRAGVVHITAVPGSGDCESVVRGRLVFCQKPVRAMDGGQGLGYPWVEHEHVVGGRAWGCSDCASDARKRVIAAHEIGHLLGLGHTADPTSVMCDRGCSEVPNQADIDALRALHDHSDGTVPPVDPGAVPDLLDGLLPEHRCTLACI